MMKITKYIMILFSSILVSSSPIFADAAKECKSEALKVAKQKRKDCKKLSGSKRGKCRTDARKEYSEKSKECDKLSDKNQPGYRDKQRVKEIVSSYNSGYKRWKAGKRSYNNTPGGLVKEIDSAFVNGVSKSTSVKVADGTFTLSELRDRVENWGNNDANACISKAHSTMKKKGDAKKLYKSKGEPHFTNYYCSKTGTDVMWVYKYKRRSKGYLEQQIYHLNPKTGKITKKETDTGTKL